MPASPLTTEAKPEIDGILETIIYLYTESRRLTKGMAREVGLTGPQLTVIKLLESFGDLSLSSLSERIRAQNSTVTGIIDRMEREGLVKRERSTTDRRVVFIRLSDKGAKLAREVEVEPMEIFRSALVGLPRDDLRDLLRILAKMEKRVRARVSGQVSTGSRSPDGASTGSRSPDGASTGSRSPDGPSKRETRAGENSTGKEDT